MVFIKGLGLMYIPYFCLLIVDLLFLFLSLYGAATAGWRAYKAPITH
ncbi:hypothetical protein [Bombilactobacillus thymidiniphilus]|uniref:Uncharacterized protein n=1 Tax=Bombilactobacillus thymidiniphilus TaxID=2923363 RepID=A0ABY4PBW5_9LACO|nr:hypothetical protein [Bombilactobacillus thymidiniphilus]UQS83049.1 hypothetical protein MOO47_04495 [Bombilactobacillus thymidiniphilus]